MVPLLLGADSASRPLVGAQPGEIPGAQIKELPGGQYQPPPLPPPEQTLVLPPQWRPTQSEPMPPESARVTEIDVAAGFIGCCKGRPNGFDEVFPFTWVGRMRIGEPGEITFCFQPHQVDVPNAEVYVPPHMRALEVAMNLGLGYTTFRAHGIKTVIYSMSPGAMHGRTTVDVDPTAHLLFVIPIKGAPQPSQVEWKAILVDRDTVHVNAYQVLWFSGQLVLGGTWHADFTRSDGPASE
jgi:hypothetical protein